MLSSGEFDVWQRLLELDVSIEVIRVENLFPPIDLNASLLASLKLQVS